MKLTICSLILAGPVLAYALFAMSAWDAERLDNKETRARAAYIHQHGEDYFSPGE